VPLDIWRRINGRNLARNILPTRSPGRPDPAQGADHTVERVHLRKL
jgi:hypothetical protein